MEEKTISLDLENLETFELQLENNSNFYIVQATDSYPSAAVSAQVSVQVTNPTPLLSLLVDNRYLFPLKDTKVELDHRTNVITHLSLNPSFQTFVTSKIPNSLNL